MNGVADDMVMIFSKDAQEDSVLFSQKVVAVLLAFVLIFALHALGFISYSLAEQVRGMMDAVMLAWMLWAFAGIMVRHSGVIKGLGIVWEFLQSFILLTFPLFAIIVNVASWNLNLLIVTPAHLIAIGAVSFIDAAISLLLELQGKSPNSLRIVLCALMAAQAAVLIFMGTYYVTDFWAGDYYAKLLAYVLH